MSNDEKIKKYKQEKILKYLTIILSFLTILLESFALFRAISFLWGLIPFTALYLIKYFFYKKSTKKENKEEKKKESKKKKSEKTRKK